MNHQLQELSTLLATGDAHREGDNLPNTSGEPLDPTAVFFERAQLDAALGQSTENPAWNELLGSAPAGEVLAKRDGTEIRKLADGDYWENTYSGGRLVKMKLCYANGRSELFDGEGKKIN